jgi:hypothetical protein
VDSNTQPFSRKRNFFERCWYNPLSTLY